MANATCNSNKKVTVSASLKKYTISIGSHPNCSVVISADGRSATNSNLYNVPYGSSCTATAYANGGYAISNVWFS